MLAVALYSIWHSLQTLETWPEVERNCVWRAKIGTQAHPASYLHRAVRGYTVRYDQFGQSLCIIYTETENSTL